MNRRTFLATTGALVGNSIAGCSVPGGFAGPGTETPPLSELPQFVSHGVIQLEHIRGVSKFRSAYGHSYSRASKEPCRSMKHYFMPYGFEPGTDKHEQTWSEIEYYAPTDGHIADVHHNEAYGVHETRFQIIPDGHPSTLLRFFHVGLREGLEIGSEVEAGEQIGTIAHEHSYGEIAVERYYDGEHGEFSENVPWSQVIDDSVFQRYRDRGVESRSEFVSTREERNEEPLECAGDPYDSDFEGRVNVDESEESFNRWSVGQENFVFLDPPEGRSDLPTGPPRSDE